MIMPRLPRTLRLWRGACHEHFRAWGRPGAAAEAGRGAGRTGPGAAVRGRSAVAEAAAQQLAAGLDHRRVGGRAGQHLGHPSRRQRAAQQRARRRTQSADRRVLPHGAAHPRLRQGRQPHQVMGRARRRLRMAAVQSRRPCRLQGQCLDRRQWREGCAGPQIHQGRQVPDAGRPFRRQQGQQRSGEFRPSGARSGSIRRPTRPISPTAISTSASR